LVLLLTPLVVGAAAVAAWNLLRPSRPSPPNRASFANGRAMTVLATVVLVLTVGVWLARFAGFFGGPVPVTSMRDWITRPR
jgi:F0F1-type ATP synthase assembly protein I